MSVNLRPIAVRLARPDILFWTLPLMMILLVAGTVAQKDVGLYVAQRDYFASFLIWFGPLPFPGGYTLLGIFFINLLAKFLLFSEWEWRKAGIILSHFGVLLLIIGGGLTAISEKEGYIVIPRGSTVDIAEDYHQRELRVLKDGVPVFRLPHDDLRAGLIISDPALPWSVTIDTYCYNCAITRRPESAQENWTTPGKFMQLSTAALDPEDAQNLTGIEFTLAGKKYLTFDKFPKPPEIKEDGHTYTFILGRAQSRLPFTLTLDAFKREVHPGSEMAKSYRSDVTVTDGSASWPASITMNEPLRYKGYTFYQSSFDESGDVPFTVLSVVQNRGRLFPYTASLIMALGLALHLVLRLRERRAGT